MQIELVHRESEHSHPLSLKQNVALLPSKVGFFQQRDDETALSSPHSHRPPQAEIKLYARGVLFAITLLFILT